MFATLGCGMRGKDEVEDVEREIEVETTLRA